MNSSLRLALFLIGSLPILPACTITSTVAGEELPASALESLQRGVSTEADVLRALGPPADLGRLQTGLIFVYRLTEESLQSLSISYSIGSGGYTGEVKRPGTLVVFFDRKGVVTGWGLSRI